MPDPIQSSSVPNQSYYDPSELVSRAPDGPTSTAPPAASPSSAATADGKDLLIKKYGSGGEDCTKHLVSASASLVVAGTSATVGLLTAPSGVGAVAGMVGTIGGIVKGSADLAAYFNCEDKNELMQDLAAECNERGGTLFDGAGDSKAICVSPTE